MIHLFSTWSNQNETPLSLIWALPGFGKRILGLYMAFSKSERFPGPPLALSRGTFRLLLNTLSNPRKHSPKPGITQISYTGVTFWLDHVEKRCITIDYPHMSSSITFFKKSEEQDNLLSFEFAVNVEVG